MPDREATADGRARLFSVYLRPWVLDRADADDAVPHIADLDLPQLAATTADLPECARQDEGKRRRLSG
jgi:hypothetical protein